MRVTGDVCKCRESGPNKTVRVKPLNKRIEKERIIVIGRTHTKKEAKAVRKTIDLNDQLRVLSKCDVDAVGDIDEFLHMSRRQSDFARSEE